ncbi:hypothetical protein BN979_02537 [Mycolicibacterium vulneris]|nr:hypothetical protein BN979_02537 [Mycolicibacterium vulneris]
MNPIAKIQWQILRIDGTTSDLKSLQHNHFSHSDELKCATGNFYGKRG